MAAIPNGSKNINTEWLHLRLERKRRKIKKKRKNEENIRKPRRKVNSNKLWDCKNCNARFDSATLLKKHNKIHKEIKNELDDEPTYRYDPIEQHYVCNICSKELNRKSEAEAHIKTHSRGFSCTICRHSLTSSLRLCLHAIQHKVDGKINCFLCPYITEDNKVFKKHAIESHSPFLCKLCGKKFLTDCDLKMHEETHDSARNYVCIVCDKAYKAKRLVVAHQVREHQVSSSGALIGNRCNLCYRYFPRDDIFAKHRTECTGVKQTKIHLCNYCGHSCKTKREIEKHIRTHTGERPFVCSVCKRGFKAKDKLVEHTRIHNGEKPYSCELCGKTFRFSSSFKTHIRSHTNERPYVCSFCRKGFTTSQGLKTHLTKCTVSQQQQQQQQESASLLVLNDAPGYGNLYY